MRRNEKRETRRPEAGQMSNPTIAAQSTIRATSQQAGRSHLGMIIGPSMLVGGLSLLNTAVSFIYQLMVAQHFGAHSDMDAYLAAMVLPNWIVLVFMVALDFTFIPIFVGHISQGREDEAWKIGNTMLK